MKRYLLVPLAVLCFFAGLKLFASNSPYPKWVDIVSGDVTFSEDGVTTIGSGKVTTGKILDGTIAEGDLAAMSASEGLYPERVAVFIYDVATDLGTQGAHTLGVSLPAKAVITQSWYKIITQFTDAGSGTVALSCEDANNILTAGDITGISANTITTGASTGSAASMVRGIGAACEITATVATADQTAGKLIGWVKYVVEN